MIQYNNKCNECLCETEHNTYILTKKEHKTKQNERNRKENKTKH